MKTAATGLRVFVGLDGLILITLGLLFWSGNADSLIPVHMLLGIALVLALWTLAVLAAIARVNLALVVVAALWGFVVPILGLTQTRLLPGAAHWLIQLLHLLVGLTAIALAQILAQRIARHQSRPPVGQHATQSGALEGSAG
ncbi:MAG TPA: hypothetical protein VFU88_03415 [Ktedonobacterales bacterium]|nr:hypothetical protein [Ktedonobacterales bacterium]